VTEPAKRLVLADRVGLNTEFAEVRAEDAERRC